MRLRDTLNKILNHEVKVNILRTLCTHATQWTGRQLAKELDISPSTASKFLRELVDEDVVNVKAAGRSNLYSINTRNYVVKNILTNCFEKEKDILASVISIIKKAVLKADGAVETAAIFGSVAQKKETPKSDIDLLIVLNNLKNRKEIEIGLDEIAIILAQDFHIAISPYILAIDELKKKHKEKAPIINEILKSHILITGKSIERLIL